MHNGPERLAFDKPTLEDHRLRLRMDGYDSEIIAEVDDDLQSMTGQWTKTVPGGQAKLGFAAQRGEKRRFVAELEAPGHEVPESVAGDWRVTFTEDDGQTFAARGVFKGSGDDLLGTFLTDTGDYRFLAGRYAQGRVQLSCFDGGHAFLFDAAVDSEGRLQGDFWSRDSYHAKWEGSRLADGDKDGLADPFAITRLGEGKRTLEFAFEDLEGNVVKHDDPRFAGKVVLIDIFGTWCPNCNDYARVLIRWQRQYAERDLQIVGLAFEMTGDPERDRQYVRKYKERFGIEFPLLLAGTSDKDKASAALPALNRVAAYPTTVLVGRDGTVRAIHSGFAGPATGRHHNELIAKLELQIERLLAEGRDSKAE